jgi:DNA-binding CsgD family transcriptional regulator
LTGMGKAVLVPLTAAGGGEPNEHEIGRHSPERARLASEIGAAMAHELNGPMTALLLYVGAIRQNSDRLIDDSLKQVVDCAFVEAERVCALIHRMGDSFEAPIPEGAAVGVARNAIAWWARTGHSYGKSGIDAGNAGEPRPGAKRLTPREQEVLRLVSEGFTNKEGAVVMKISYRTFECHRAEVMRKMGAKNAVELVRLALLEPPCIRPSTQQDGA